MLPLRPPSRRFGAACALVALAWMTASWSAAQNPGADAPQTRWQNSAMEAPQMSLWGKQAVSFVENIGQLENEWGWLVQGSQHTLAFGQNGIRVMQRLDSENEKTSSWHSLDVSFPGVAGNVDFRAEAPLPGRVHFYFGAQNNWKLNRSRYQSLVAKDLWLGIDLRFDGDENSLKYAFHVAAGVSADVICMQYDGADSIFVNENGCLVVETPAGNLVDPAPIAWQIKNQQRQKVAASWQVQGKIAQLVVGEYDPTLALIVDPEMLVFSGFLGGTNNDEIRGIGTDNLGNIYVAGLTESNNLPTLNAEQDFFRGGEMDVFVAKLDSNGTLLYLTYLGGDDKDLPYSLECDAAGNAYLVGGSQSGNWPSMGGGVDINGVNKGGVDGFVTKLDPTGVMIYSGMFGGTGFDSIRGNCVGDDGSHYVIGRSFTDDDTFPIISGPGHTHSGLSDIFVAKISPNGTTLEYCGFVGGSEIDYGRDIAVDDRGFAYITGWTNSDENSFPVTMGPDLTYNGGHQDFGLGWEQYGDAFVAKLLPDGSDFVYCGYIGGARAEGGFGIQIDGNGAAYVAGHTSSNESLDPESGLFPVKVGPSLEYSGPSNPDQPYGDAFIAKVNRDGTTLDFCGYVGGSKSDRAWRLERDSYGNLYLVGDTISRPHTLPHQSVGPRLSFSGKMDGFLSMVSPNGKRILYCTYMGGSGQDRIRDVITDPSGNVYVAGWTESASDFPQVGNPGFSHQGMKDGWVARIPAYHILLRGGTALDNDGENEDVLLVDGSAGADYQRMVTVTANQNFTVSLGGRLNGESYSLFQQQGAANRRWLGQKNHNSKDLGNGTFPLGTPIGNFTGSTQLNLATGVWTLQAIVIDDNNPLGSSLTNAIVVTAE